MEDIRSISSMFLLVNKIVEGNSNFHFEKIIIAHEEYTIDPERILESKKVISEMEVLKQDNLFKTRKIFPENLKSFLHSLLEEFEEIYIVHGFSNLEDISKSLNWISEIFPKEKTTIFNTMEKSYGDSEAEICHHNLNKFLDYISQK